MEKDRSNSRACLVKHDFGKISVDLLNGIVLRDGERVQLSTIQLRLLRYLILHEGTIVSRKAILNEVWGYRAMRTRTLDVHVSGLRQKLEDVPHEPRHIVTVRGEGYMFRG